jgi:hypothetical protein
MREDELKEALARLRVSLPESRLARHEDSLPSSAFITRPAEPAPPFVDDSDDPYALPRFREPKIFLPEGERTFLRAICVKPRLLFVTWDVATSARESLEGSVELHVFWRDFLGDAPPSRDVQKQEPAFRAPVDLSSTGWYVSVPGERLAISAALVVVPSGRRLVESNVTLAPPGRAAPPGPHWVATLPPSLDRRRLSERKLMKGEAGDLRRIGETDARGLDVEFEDEPLPASATAMRLPWMQGAPVGIVASSSTMPSSFTSASAVTAGKKP